MTTLNKRLVLAILSRKKRHNILEKGFTLVELMVVIVIVGILSAVALPNFMSQTDKAKATEASTKIGALLKEAHAEYQYDGSTASVTTAMDTATTGPLAVATATGNFTYTGTGFTNTSVYNIMAEAKTAAAGGDATIEGELMYGCVDVLLGDPEISTKLLAAATATDVDCQ